MDIINSTMWNMKSPLGSVCQQDTKLQPWWHFEFLLEVGSGPWLWGWKKWGRSILFKLSNNMLVALCKDRRNWFFWLNLCRSREAYSPEKGRSWAFTLHQPDQTLGCCWHKAKPSHMSAACLLSNCEGKNVGHWACLGPNPWQCQTSAWVMYYPTGWNINIYKRKQIKNS